MSISLLQYSTVQWVSVYYFRALCSECQCIVLQHSAMSASLLMSSTVQWVSVFLLQHCAVSVSVLQYSTVQWIHVFCITALWKRLWQIRRTVRKNCPLRRVPRMLTLSWGAQPRRTVRASEGPPEGTVIPHCPEDLIQLLRLSKSWGLAHPELE